MNNIIFDLDGTLIDSSEGIINTIIEVSETFSLKKVSKFEIKKAIGPKLEDLINFLFPSMNAHTKELFVKEFVKKYDKNNCLLYKPLYEKSTLEYLKQNNYMGLITNKRTIPTLKILRNSKINKLFDFVICSDSFSKKNNKRENYNLIYKVYPKYKKNIKTFYIGDTIDDLNFTKDIGINFIGVEFSEKLPKKNYLLIKSINDLKKVF